MSNIKDFTELDSWKTGHNLVLAIYKTTQTFPDEEKYGLTSQIRRASVSITSNIAEGFGRFSTQEKIRFYQIALGSVTEVQNQIYVARDVNYISTEASERLICLTVDVHKLIFGLIRSIKNKS